MDWACCTQWKARRIHKRLRKREEARLLEKLDIGGVIVIKRHLREKSVPAIEVELSDKHSHLQRLSHCIIIMCASTFP